jgi:TetR/AcrR family transcriptional regulator, cholesterol catabolism regulator
MANSSGIGRRRSAAKEDASESYHRRRKEITEAAVRAFNQRGFTAASISAVAAEMNIDRATLYYYIGSKEELFDEVLREVIENNAAIAGKILASKMSPRRKLRDMITALMSSYGTNCPLIYIYIRENLSYVSDRRSAWSKHMRALNHEIEDAIISIMRIVLSNHLPPPAVARLAGKVCPESLPLRLPAAFAGCGSPAWA